MSSLLFYKIRNTDSSGVTTSTTLKPIFIKDTFKRWVKMRLILRRLLSYLKREICVRQNIIPSEYDQTFSIMVFIIAHSISTALISISFIIFFSFIAHSESFYTSFTILILAVCKWRVDRKTYKTHYISHWIKWVLKFTFSVLGFERVYFP